MSAPQKFADLHLHTFYSDGTDSPVELVSRAGKNGLSCIALTDHDTINGIPETIIAAADAGCEFIPGVELTAHLDEHELHILGYGINWRDEEFCRQLAHFQKIRHERVERIVARLNELGVAITADAVFKISGCGSAGRPHVARALVEGGFVRSAQEAFVRLLGRNKPAFVPKWKIPVAQVVQLIRTVGGVAVLAHPGLAGVDRRIEELVQQGIQGLEVFHSTHSATATQRYEEMAHRYSLLITGGSDCHGKTKGAPTMGTVKLPYEYVEKLRAAAEKMTNI